MSDGDREPGRDVKRSVGRCLVCAVCCRLLRERALAKRRGEQSERGMRHQHKAMGGGDESEHRGSGGVQILNTEAHMRETVPLRNVGSPS